MAAVMDLIAEYGVLSDQKIRRGGTLAPSDEDRWAELDAFFDLLMRQPGLPPRADRPPFAADEIRAVLTERLRVPTEGFAVLRHEDGFCQARIANLSRGGVFLAAQHLLAVGSRTTLYLAGIDRIEEVLEVEGEVIWSTKRGISRAALPRGMGIRFVDTTPEIQVRIDDLIARSIKMRLAGLW